MFLFLELKDFGWDTLHLKERFDLDIKKCPDDLERVNGLDLSIEEFVEKYEKPRLPVVLTNLQNDWPAKEKWTFDVRNEIALAFCQILLLFFLAFSEKISKPKI